MKARRAYLFNRLTRVTVADPDLARRGQVLSILILTFIGIGGVLIPIALLTYPYATPAEQPTLLALPPTLVGLATIYLANRKGFVRQSVIAFLFAMLVFIPLFDTPMQVVDGRSTMLFTIPIFAASLLLSPAASFAFAALASVEVVLLGLRVNYLANSYFFTTSVFFVVASVSWLASRSLDQALTQVRANEERTRSILDSITDGVLALAVTDQALIVDANPSAAQLLKRSTATDLIGLSVEQALNEVAPEDWAIIRSSFQQETAVAEWPVQIGRTVLTATIVPLRAPQVGAAHAERSLLLMLRNSTREAEAERLHAEFSMLIAQGLLTPLGIMEMLSEELVKGKNFGGLPLTPETRQSAAETLFVQAQRLKQTVSDLLDRDQLSHRRLDVSLNTVTLMSCLAEIEVSVRQPAAARGVRVTVKQLPLSPERVITDGRLLVQAGRNLVNHLLAQTQAAEILIRVGNKDVNHWIFQVTDYPETVLPYGPLLSSETLVTPEPTVNWLLAEQVVTALQGELRVGQQPTGQVLIQAMFDGLGRRDIKAGLTRARGGSHAG